MSISSDLDNQLNLEIKYKKLVTTKLDILLVNGGNWGNILPHVVDMAFGTKRLTMLSKLKMKQIKSMPTPVHHLMMSLYIEIDVIFSGFFSIIIPDIIENIRTNGNYLLANDNKNNMLTIDSKTLKESPWLYAYILIALYYTPEYSKMHITKEGDFIMVNSESVRKLNKSSEPISSVFCK